MFSALVIHASPEQAPLLRAMVADTGQILVMRELTSPPGNYELSRLLNTLVPDIVLLDMSGGDISLDCAARITELAPSTPLLGFACPPQLQQIAKQVGFSVTLPSIASTDDLKKAIRVALERHHAACERYLYSFLPSKAGSGASTVVLNTAAALARMGKRVLVIDADLRSSVLSVMLGVKPKGGTQGALAISDQLDTFSWRNCLFSLDNVDFLLSTRAIDSQPPEWANYYQLINFTRSQYDAILVDLPELINPATIEVVRRSRLLFPVCTPEIPSLQLTIQRLEEIERLGVPDDRVGVLLNRHHRTDPDLAKLAELIGRRIMKAFPNDYPLVHTAIAAGRAVPGETKLGRVFGEFASQLVEETVAQEAGLKKRLRGMLGWASA